MSDPRIPPLKERLLDEIWGEMSSLKGNDLDLYLRDIGLNPDELLEANSKALNNALSASKRARFELAREHVRKRPAAATSQVVSFDLAKKRDIMASIKAMSAKTGAMTIAARNQKMETEQDLDSFLEACLALGVIDDNGNLKE